MDFFLLGFLAPGCSSPRRLPSSLFLLRFLHGFLSLLSLWSFAPWFLLWRLLRRSSLQPTRRLASPPVRAPSMARLPRACAAHLPAAAALTGALGSVPALPALPMAKQMLDRLKELSKKSDGKVLAVDMQTDLLGHKICKTSSDARRKCCYNPQEVMDFLKKVGFSANTTIYLTETWWHKGLNTLKEAFPNTYTKYCSSRC